MESARRIPEFFPQDPVAFVEELLARVRHFERLTAYHGHLRESGVDSLELPDGPFRGLVISRPRP